MTVRVGIAVLCLALLAGCSSKQERFTPGPSIDEQFASATLEDWVENGHHLAVYAVVAERELPPRGLDPGDDGGGRLGREVTLRVERLLWSARDAPRMPRQFRTNAVGWDTHDGKREELDLGIPWVRVGERYVAPMRRFGRRRWGPLGGAAQLKLDGDHVPARGQSVDELAADLRAAARP